MIYIYTDTKYYVQIVYNRCDADIKYIDIRMYPTKYGVVTKINAEKDKMDVNIIYMYNSRNSCREQIRF